MSELKETFIKQYYTILGVSENASADEVKKAYKQRALETHPDQGGNQEEFLKVQEAWEVLSGKKQAPREHRPPTDNYGWGSFDFSKFNFDPFNINRGPPTEEKPPRQDSDIRVTIQSNIQEVKGGKVYRVKYNLAVDCESCEGRGAETSSECATCKGRGIVQHANNQQGMFYFVQTAPCAPCSGRGKIFTNPCKDCETKGYTLKEEKLSFKIEVVKEE